MANSRSASGSLMQAGERRTVRHGVGMLRNIETAASAMMGMTRNDIRHKGVNSYAF